LVSSVNSRRGKESGDRCLIDQGGFVKLLSVSVVIALVLLADAPVARQEPGTFMTYGAGAGTCAAWTERLKDTNGHARDLQWVFGFVSAAGVFAGVQLKVEADGIEPFMTSHCQANPADTITMAAATLVGKLRR
jgi:hypothetical protein